MILQATLVHKCGDAGRRLPIWGSAGWGVNARCGTQIHILSYSEMEFGEVLKNWGSKPPFIGSELHSS